MAMWGIVYIMRPELAEDETPFDDNYEGQPILRFSVRADGPTKALEVSREKLNRLVLDPMKWELYGLHAEGR